MIAYIEVHTTVNSVEDAQKIAASLVTKRLASAVQVSGPITSTYWWKGKIEITQEWICTAKTQQSLYNAVEQAIRTIHPYEVPEILATPILAGNASYLEWVTRETKASEGTT